jgi:hypothetical protein
MPDNAAGVIYGIILVATMLSAESAVRETYAKTAGGVLVAMATYWLALTYSRFTGERLEQGEHATVALLVRAAKHEVTVLYGAVIPFAALLIFWLAGTSLNTGALAVVYVADATIIATELIIGIRAELTGRELLAQTAIGAVLGVLVLALRLLLH